jgi:hypothetical protein
MFPTLNLATIPSTNLVQLFAKSTYLANSIIYDQNLAFAYIDVQAQLTSSNTLGFDVNPVSVSTASTPASIYSINIDVTPSISNIKGGNFTLEIYYNSVNSTHNSGTGQKDFNFMGLCQSTSASGGVSAVVLNFCSISSDLSTITFSVAQVIAGTKIRITTQVQNPLYKSIRGIRGFWTDFISGIVK